MLDSVIAFLWSSDMSNQTFVGDEFPLEKAQSFIDLIYQTSDGYISVAVQTDKQWAALTRALDRPQWLADPRFATPAARQENIDARLSLTQEVLLERSSADWLERLDAEDVPCAPVLRRREVVGHPQVLANEIVVETDHPQAGRLRQARPAARFSRTPAGIRSGGPALGQHSVEALEELGYPREKIDELAEAGVIGTATMEPA
jgi:crotonobetainyl-CoA:carnitine CoA-transferase CaiB-like acyl-CoA transferase